MTTYKKTQAHIRFVTFLTKLLIYVFGIAGILLESNMCYIISLTVWVWLTPCVQFEWKLIALVNKGITKWTR
jgi:hypothetical protein